MIFRQPFFGGIPSRLFDYATILGCSSIIVIITLAIENGPVEIVDFPIKNGGSFHRNSGFSHEKWWFSIEIVDFPIKNGGSFHSKMLVYQAGYPPNIQIPEMKHFPSQP